MSPAPSFAQSVAPSNAPSIAQSSVTQSEVCIERLKSFTGTDFRRLKTNTKFPEKMPSSSEDGEATDSDETVKTETDRSVNSEA